MSREITRGDDAEGGTMHGDTTELLGDTTLKGGTTQARGDDTGEGGRRGGHHRGWDNMWCPPGGWDNMWCPPCHPPLPVSSPPSVWCLLGALWCPRMSSPPPRHPPSPASSPPSVWCLLGALWCPPMSSPPPCHPPRTCHPPLQCGVS